MNPLFGTDGIRARAGEAPLTPAIVASVAQAFGALLLRRGGDRAEGGRPFVLLGHDGRASADYLVAAIEAGLGAGGIDYQEAGLITTPGLASLVRELSAAGGVMVSASHNPAQDNGIKLFGRGGEKLADADEREIEAAVASSGSLESAPRFGQRRPGSALRPELYLNGLIDRAGVTDNALVGFKIAFDGANGGGSLLGGELFRMLGAEVLELATSPDGNNINDGVGALHPARLADRVLGERCALGVALDGDGDRSMFVDETGAIVDGDGVLAACAPDLLARGRLPRSAIVSSVMTNYGLHGHLRNFGITIDVVPVGDRHIVARLKDQGLALGAEPSGHVIFGRDNEYIGDGLYTALRLVELLRRAGKRLSELAHFPRSEQVLINVPVKRKDPLESIPQVSRAKTEAELSLGSAGRIVLRYSGTEPLARVMVEAPARSTAEQHAFAIAQAIRETLG
jgi:phosphoglucosamine mutase